MSIALKICISYYYYTSLHVAVKAFYDSSQVCFTNCLFKCHFVMKMRWKR